MSLDPAALDPVRRRLTLLAMCIGQGMILLDNTVVNVALRRQRPLQARLRRPRRHVLLRHALGHRAQNTATSAR